MNVWWVYLSPQNIPRAIVSTLGNRTEQLQRNVLTYMTCFSFSLCRRIGEYVSLELFCFVNLTSSCSFIPLGNKVILYRIVLYHIVLCCIVYHDCLDVREADSSLVWWCPLLTQILKSIASMCIRQTGVYLVWWCPLLTHILKSIASTRVRQESVESADVQHGVHHWASGLESLRQLQELQPRELKPSSHPRPAWPKAHVMERGMCSHIQTGLDSQSQSYRQD